MRTIQTAEILAIGSELTTGATRDTNSGELARELTGHGVRVLCTTALPDELETVTQAFTAAMEHADLVVSTGGLGPTPDDLTREAIAAACGIEPRVDAELEAWLRGLFVRRGIVMPEANRKQAWLIDGALALPNARGSAPGWLVERPDGSVIVALPGPPREMWPMWQEHALPRLIEHGLGKQRVAHTLRLTGVGESQLVDLIGEEILRAADPQVATYARAEAVDVVVSSDADAREDAAGRVEQMIARLRESIGRYVFAEGDESWPEALARRLAGRSLAVVEIGTGGQLTALLGAAGYLRHAELRPEASDLKELAARARVEHRADIGLALDAREVGGDTRVRVAIADPSGVDLSERTAFLAGDEGRRRAALAACAVLWQRLSATRPDA